MTQPPDGKLGVKYGEQSRWLQVYNVGPGRIEPHAPCYLTSVQPIDENLNEPIYAVAGFVGTRNNSSSVGSPELAAGMVVNGLTAIEPNRYGRVTRDWPAVARVKISSPEYREFGISVSHQCFVDISTLSTGQVASSFSDVAQDFFELSRLDYRSIAYIVRNAFKVIGVADEAKELFWVIPGPTSLIVDREGTTAIAESGSQSLSSPLVFEASSEQPFCVVTKDGNLSFNLPGQYAMYLEVVVNPGPVETVDETSVIDHVVDFESESLSEHLEELSFGGTLGTFVKQTLRQPSYLRRIICGDYGSCPSIEVERPGVSQVRVVQFAVRVNEDWPQPAYGEADDAEPLVELRGTRLTTFLSEEEIPGMTVTVIVERQPFYVNAHFGNSWGTPYFGYYFGNYQFAVQPDLLNG